MMARKKNMERRKVILNSAFTLIRQQGLDGVSLQMIAEESGISKSLLQSYYPHKTRLTNDILHNMMSTILSKLNEYGIASSNEYTATMVFINTALELGDRDPGLYNVLNSIFGNPETIDRWVQLITVWLKEEGLRDAFGKDQDVRIGLTYMISGGGNLYAKRTELGLTAEKISYIMVSSFLTTFLNFDKEQISRTMRDARDLISKTDIDDVHQALSHMFDEDAVINS